MRWPVHRLPVFSLLACLLIGMASADDFCLPRLLFFGAPSAATELPLDDPNTDFVKAGERWAAWRQGHNFWDRPDIEGAAPKAAGHAPAADRPTACRLTSQRLPFPQRLIPLPLRC